MVGTVCLRGGVILWIYVMLGQVQTGNVGTQGVARHVG